jgi:hypothetical protein
MQKKILHFTAVLTIVVVTNFTVYVIPATGMSEEVQLRMHARMYQLSLTRSAPARGGQTRFTRFEGHELATPPINCPKCAGCNRIIEERKRKKMAPKKAAKKPVAAAPKKAAKKPAAAAPPLVVQKDFDSQVYLALHPGMKIDDKGNRDLWAKRHYFFKGKARGWAYLPVVPEDFDPVVYIALYSDLQEVVTGDRNFWAKKHYFLHGQEEARSYLPIVPVDFNSETYLSLNPDLEVAISGDRVSWAKKNYFLYGKDQNRTYK